MQQGRVHSARLKRTEFERPSMSSSERMLSPACRCGKQMQLSAPRIMPDCGETHIDVFQCETCGHEMRVTVWGEERRLAKT